MSKELTPDFSCVFNGLIWKTIPDTTGNLLAVEVRNNEDHIASFNVLDFNSGNFILKDWVFPEPWWVNLTAFLGPNIYIRIFLDDSNPSRTELFAFDIHKKIILWKIADLEPIEFSAKMIRAYSGEGENRRICIVDPRTGNIIYPAPAPAGQYQDSSEYRNNPALHYPVHYPEQDENFKIVKKYLARFEIEPCLAIDYIEFSTLIIINYYNRTNKSIENFLLVLDNEGSVLFHKNTGSGLPGAGMDTFFIMHNDLIFARNKNNLMRIRLT